MFSRRLRLSISLAWVSRLGGKEEAKVERNPLRRATTKKGLLEHGTVHRADADSKEAPISGGIVLSPAREDLVSIGSRCALTSSLHRFAELDRDLIVIISPPTRK